MRSIVRFALTLLIASSAASSALAEPPAVPATRQEMKQILDQSKRNVPRLPLPDLTAAEKQEAEAKAKAGELFPIVNNRRMRERYLPVEVVGGGFSRKSDPSMSLDNSFKTMLFWIASRANNCEYCMGHQESKLTADGIVEDRIAALDGDWSEFSPAEQAAFGLVKKLTIAPHKLTDADVAALKSFYSDRQILEIVYTSAGHNAMNRWTGALRIPQEEFRVYLTPTADRYRDRTSSVAPLKPAPRPALESREVVAAKVDEARKRTPRITPASESEARSILPPEWSKEALPEWVKLLALFPEAGKMRILMNRGAEEAGELKPLVKAQIAWIAARQDRAWYALGHAQNRLKGLGLSDDQIFAIDDESQLSEAERSVSALARKLTSAPALVEDADIAAVRKHFSDKQTAEIVFQITEAAFMNRLTEAAGLRLEL